jgi:hypothetical protein
MIVFNLACSQQHQFDGWFRSSEDFDTQHAKRMIACPMCGDLGVSRQLSAPRINIGASASTAPGKGHQANAETGSNKAEGATLDSAHEVVAASMLPDLQAHMLRQFKQFVMANTENVGGAFAETARRMHYGEETHRNIRGRVSVEESQALREEGIETVGLPAGIMLDEQVQ